MGLYGKRIIVTMSVIHKALLINCGMVPVSAVSTDGSVSLGYWHRLSCEAGECFAPDSFSGYKLKEFPIIKHDAGKHYYSMKGKRQ